MLLPDSVDDSPPAALIRCHLRVRVFLVSDHAVVHLEGASDDSLSLLQARGDLKEVLCRAAGLDHAPLEAGASDDVA